MRQKEQKIGGEYVGAQIIIDREEFKLVLEALRRDGSIEEVYTSRVALGDPKDLTPTGKFLINHVYCYPDVILYDDNEVRLPNVYKGFLAPLLICDEEGNCDRYQDLGIHGFDASAHPNRERIRPDTYGPVSHGCIRVPDPCGFKTALIRMAGVGPVKKNDRGCYHWLQKPVPVWIVDRDSSVAALIKEGFLQVGRGIKSLLKVFTQ